MKTECVLAAIENCFSFLDKKGFIKKVFLVENLEMGVTYSDSSSDLKIVITYDKREHTIDYGVINNRGNYSPLYEVLYKFPRYCTPDELVILKNASSTVISKKNIQRVLDWTSEYIDKHIELIKTYE